jgi:hypothetical protein
LNDKLFGFIQVDIETTENSKDHFSEMTPIFKNAEIKFEDIGEYMQNYHKRRARDVETHWGANGCKLFKKFT